MPISKATKDRFGGPVQKGVPETIYTIRAITQMSLADFGDKVGVSPQAVSHWEQGRRKPGVTQALELVKVASLHHVKKPGTNRNIILEDLLVG